jgi:hypothetical protein
VKKGRRSGSAVLSAAALILLLLVLALVMLVFSLHRDGERALSGVFPASPLIFADLRDAAELWEDFEEKNIPDLLKKSRSLYELERFPAVSRLLELRRELEADSGMPIDDDLLMHVAGKGAALGFFRLRQGGTIQWIAAFRTSLPAWVAVRAYFLRNGAGRGAGRGKSRVYRGRRLHMLEGSGIGGQTPQFFFIGDAVVAASGAAAAEAALDCIESAVECFRGRDDTVFESLDPERSGDLHFLIRPPAMEGVQGIEAPGDPWPQIGELVVNVDVGARTRAVFSASVNDWGALRPDPPGGRNGMKVHRYIGNSPVLIAAGRGMPLPEGVALLAPVGDGGTPGALQAREWVLAVRDFRVKEFIPFPRSLLIVDEGSSRGALEALHARFPHPAEKIRISGLPLVLSSTVHRWGVELRPGGAAFDRYAAFAFDRSLLEETVLSAGRGGEERRGGGERSPAMEPLGDTIFYAAIDNARLVTALRRIAVPLSSALGEGGSELPGITADIEIFSTLRSAVIRVDAAGRTISGEVDLSFGAP